LEKRRENAKYPSRELWEDYCYDDIAKGKEDESRNIRDAYPVSYPAAFQCRGLSTKVTQ